MQRRKMDLKSKKKDLFRKEKSINAARFITQHFLNNYKRLKARKISLNSSRVEDNKNANDTEDESSEQGKRNMEKK